MKIGRYIKKQLKTAIVMAFLLLAGGLDAQQLKSCRIEIHNPGTLAMEEKVVEVTWKDILQKIGPIDTATLVVLDDRKKPQTWQLATGANGVVETLLLQVSLQPGKRKVYTVTTGKPYSKLVKAYGRYVPERYDDFAWENDKIAFRMYGKALESTSFNALGIDVWAKRTSAMVIDRWYKSDDYHTDHGEGLDFYGVGNSLGAGGCAPYFNDSICHSRNYTSFKVLDNGPLRIRFSLTYDPWVVGNRIVSATKTISLDAGSYFNKVEVQYVFAGEEVLPVAIGINQKAGPDIKMLDARNGSIGYWLPADSTHGTIGVGVFLKSGFKKLNSANGHLMAVVEVKPVTTLAYYTGACWDKEGVFTKSTDWFGYLQGVGGRLKQPIIKIF